MNEEKRNGGDVAITALFGEVWYQHMDIGQMINAREE